MEEKEKIVLLDGTEYSIENGAIENRIQIPIQNIYEFPEIFEKFTDENLENYRILNADGLTCGTFKNKTREKAEVTKDEDGLKVTMVLKDVDMVQKRLEALESGQEVQNGAISDLGEAVSGLAEEGGLA